MSMVRSSRMSTGISIEIETLAIGVSLNFVKHPHVGVAGLATWPLVAHDAGLVREEVDATVGQVVAKVLLQLFSHHGGRMAARRANDGHVA